MNTKPIKQFKMKTRLRISCLVILALWYWSCGESPNNSRSNKDTLGATEEETTGKSSNSGDYSALFTDFSCDITASEIAQPIEIPINDIKKTTMRERTEKIFGSDFPLGKKEESKAQNSDDCMFELEGFGVNKLGTATFIEFRTTDLGRATIKHAITEDLKHRDEGIEKLTQRFIVEADFKDNYITTKPLYGRVNIYNENYDETFIITYGTLGADNDRTKEQHEVLTEKMIKLANQLLKKYRK